jgi:ATP-dependent RNA helicase DeaD
MKKPVEYSISKEQLVNKNIIHQYYSIKVKDKKDTLERIMEMEPEFYGVIFCKTRRKTNELAEQLNADGVPAQALNGELSQAQRDRVMHSFKSKNARILVATDIAARGIDVDSLTHVIHYSLPHDPEYYTHRSGRTARAGKKGFSIALVSPGEVRKYKHMMQQLQLSSEKLDPPLFKEIIAHKIRKWEQDIQTVDDSQISKELGGTEYKVFQDLEKHELVRKLIAYQFSKQWKNAQQEARRHVKPDRFDDREDHSESFDRSRRKNSRGGEVQIFVNIGKMDRITKKSLVAILAKRGGLSAQDMGPIEIHKRHSTFSVSKKLAKSLATRFRGERHRGRKLIVKIDEMT